MPAARPGILARRGGRLLLAQLREFTCRELRLVDASGFGKLPRVREFGYSDVFIRLWEYYLYCCEGGFLERQPGTVQMLLTRPACRREVISTSG